MKKDEVHTAGGLTFQDVVKDNTRAYVISDEDGPVMAVRVHTALRFAIQFNPDAPYRSAKNIKKVVKWLESIARDEGATELIIRPGGKAVRMADKLGFKDFSGSKILEV